MKTGSGYATVLIWLLIIATLTLALVSGCEIGCNTGGT